MNSLLKFMCTVFAMSFALGTSGFADEPVDINGTWDWQMSVGLIRKKVSMEVVQNKGDIQIKVTTEDGNTLDVTSVELKKDQLRFEMTKKAPLFGKVKIRHSGKVTGNFIAGSLEMEGGPGGKGKWEAKRRTE